MEVLRAEAKRAHKASTKAVLEAKERCFHDFLLNMDPSKDPGAPFRILKAMETSSGNPRDAALHNDTKVATSARDMANLAINHYASVNRVMRNKTEDRNIRAQARPIKQCPPDCNYCLPFTACELEVALRKQSGKAAGPDCVPLGCSRTSH